MRTLAKLFCQILVLNDPHSGKKQVVRLEDLIEHDDAEVVAESLEFLIQNVGGVAPAVLKSILRRVSTETNVACLKSMFDVASKTFHIHKNVFLNDATKTTESVVDAMNKVDSNYPLLSSAVRLTGHLFADMEKVTPHLFFERHLSELQRY